MCELLGLQGFPAFTELVKTLLRGSWKRLKNIWRTGRSLWKVCHAISCRTLIVLHAL